MILCRRFANPMLILMMILSLIIPETEMVHSLNREEGTRRTRISGQIISSRKKNHPSSPEPVKLPEEAPEKVDDDIRRGYDGSIRRHRNIPNHKKGRRAGLFARLAIPPGVRRLSAKQIFHCKRLAARRQVGNGMFARAEMEEVPTVETLTLIISPPSKFIHFAANNCGYARRRLDLCSS